MSWKITWTKKEDLGDVLTMLTAVGATEKIAKVKSMAVKKGQKHSSDTVIKNKIKDKVK